MATATAKKIEMFPDEVFLRAAIKDGRAVKKELSLKAIGVPDTRLQQRVEMNVDHIRKLERILHDDGNLRPIIVFEEQEPYNLHVADGFHRHASHKNARRDSIWAWVIQGTWRDAMLYSTMCNQDMCLKRTSEDIRKACEALFADAEWGHKTGKAIAERVGVSCAAVRRWRADWHERERVPYPELVTSARGIIRSSTIPVRGAKPKIHRVRGGFSMNVNGGPQYLGVDKVDAEKKRDEWFARKDQKRSLLRANANLIQFFASRRICVKAMSQSRQPGIYGFDIRGVITTWTLFEKSDDLPAAVGRLFLMRQEFAMPDSRIVVLCFAEDGPAHIIEQARALGVEFLTPDELVASLNGESEVEASDLTS